MRSITTTLESVERENRLALKREMPDARKGLGCTLITAWTRRPATIILVEPRRMLVQEDLVIPNEQTIFRTERLVTGTIHGFRRVLNSKKWTYASDWRIRGQRTLGVIIGQRMFEEPEISDAATD